MTPTPPLPSVLLVDDGLVDLRLVLSAIDREKLAYQFKVLRDGQAAIDFLLAKGIFTGQETVAGLKLILLDLRLPSVDGLEVLKVIKSHPRLRLIPVIILSGSADPEDIERAYAAGANSYLVKPWAIDEFRWVIGRLRDYWLGLNLMPTGAPTKR